MDKPAHRGAQISARNRTPSVDLVRLLELLAKAIPHGEKASGNLRDWPLLGFDRDMRRIRVNTRSVLSRLFAGKDFTEAFRAGDDSGFLRDAVAPPRSTNAKMGGRLVEERAADLTNAVSKLSKTVADALTELLVAEHVKLDDLVHGDAK